MADITVTAAKVAVLYPSQAEIYDMIAAAAITAGQVVYQTSAGKAGLADANGSGTRKVVGIALNAAAAGKAVSVLKRGFVAGFTLSGAYDSEVFLSDTAGALADTQSTTTPIRVGKVMPMSDKDITKILYVEALWKGGIGPLTVFVSAEQTGNGSSQDIAHGLGVIPYAAVAIPTDLTASTVGQYAAVAGTHDATNVKYTVTNGKKYVVVAWG